MGRKNIYFTPRTQEYLESKDNYSEYIQNLIIRDMNDKSQYLAKKEDLLRERKRLQIRMSEVDQEITNTEKELDRIDELRNSRPDEYSDCVNVLLHLGSVTHADLDYQANRLGIEVALLKQWLFDDGVYDTLFLK